MVVQFRLLTTESISEHITLFDSFDAATVPCLLDSAECSSNWFCSKKLSSRNAGVVMFICMHGITIYKVRFLVL